MVKKRYKILVAEDQEIGIYTIFLLLENKYDLIFAKNGKEAVEKFFSEKPDLVLMDIMMPELNGFEAFDQIRKRKGSASIKIIAITARAMKDEKETILKHGFDDYISKPVDDDLLFEKIRKYLPE